jgi:hypothetical protein
MGERAPSDFAEYRSDVKNAASASDDEKMMRLYFGKAFPSPVSEFTSAST